jgi:hypothetical protein
MEPRNWFSLDSVNRGSKRKVVGDASAKVLRRQILAEHIIAVALIGFPCQQFTVLDNS